MTGGARNSLGDASLSGVVISNEKKPNKISYRYRMRAEDDQLVNNQSLRILPHKARKSKSKLSTNPVLSLIDG
jgi:hypothetical protein